jgi:hypothetical protein
MKKIFCLGERENPQFKNPYYTIYGLLTKKKKLKKKKIVYMEV